MLNYDILLKKKGDTMPKIKIKYTVSSKSSDLDETYYDSKEVDAILENDKIKYKENNTTVIFNYLDKTLRRQNDHIDMIHDCNKLESNSHVKSIGRNINNDIELDTYNVDNHNIMIKYETNDVEIEYKVEV